MHDQQELQWEVQSHGQMGPRGAGGCWGRTNRPPVDTDSLGHMVTWGYSALFVVVRLGGTLHLGTFTSSTIDCQCHTQVPGSRHQLKEVSKEPGGVEFRVVNQSNQSSQLTMYDDGFLRFRGKPEYDGVLCRGSRDAIRRCLDSPRRADFISSLSIKSSTCF